MRKLALLALLGIASCGGDTEPAANGGSELEFRPDIPVILVSLDTLRADRLASYGSERENDPWLSELAREGVVFLNCFSQSSSTGPAHRSLFTGQFVHRHGHKMFEYTRSPYMMAGLLKSVGYETVCFGGGGFVNRQLGFDQGFDYFKIGDDGLAKGEQSGHRGFRTILPQAEEWYEERQAVEKSMPFFLFLHTYDIHCPYWPEQPWRARYGAWYHGELELMNSCGKRKFAPLFADGKELQDDDRKYLVDMYDGGIRTTDDYMKEFFDRLRADGTLDRSLVIVTSDHGESLGEHRWIGHELMWEEQLRIPLIVRFPKGEFGGTVSEEPAMLVDVLPTLLDYLGLSIPPGVQGQSLMDSLRGEQSWLQPERGFERLVLSEHRGRIGLRFDGQWKLQFEEGADGPTRAAIYDLLQDPGEEHDLIETEAGRAAFDRLYARYKDWRSATATDDERFRGKAIEDPLDPELMTDLSELGYAGFEQE